METIQVINDWSSIEFGKYWIAIVVVYLQYQFTNDTRQRLLSNIAVIGIVMLSEFVINNWWRIS